ncbi:MAG: polyketide cyclase [Pirellula sp.]|nr:polyketide cyclase [Pirellula sp.]
MFRKLLLIVFCILLGAVGTVVALASRYPDHFVMARKITIDAPPSAVFAQINDFHNWEKWSPWAKMDPNAKATFEGPASGEGATFGWAGNEQVGEGTMKIVRSRPDALIDVDLRFIKPFEDQADVQFTLVPVDGKTVLEWSMSGNRNLAQKAICLCMNMDRMVGTTYEEGLANIKRVVESGNKTAAAEPTK